MVTRHGMLTTVESLSIVWCKIKKDNPSMDFLDKIELVNVSSLGEITIAYPSIYGTKDLNDGKEKVNALLRDALGEHIKFKWVTDEDWIGEPLPSSTSAIT